MKTRIGIAALLMVVMLMATLLVSCSSAAPGSSAQSSGNVYPENGLPRDTKVTLKCALVESGNGKEFKQFAADSFHEKFPNVSFEIVFNPEVYKLVDAKIQANVPEEMFDVIEYDNPAQLIQAGKLEPQDDLWNRSPYDLKGKTMKDLSSQMYYDASFDSGWPDGKKHVSALPFMGGSGGGFYFNKKLFTDNGWNQDPKTWDEFQALCQSIKDKGITPIVFTGVYPTYLTDLVSNVKPFEIAEMNGNLDAFIKNYRGWTGAQYTSPESLETWNRLASLGKKGYFAEGMSAMNHTQSQMMVLQGKAAMVVTGTWVGNEMADATPQGFEWGYMPLPFVSKPEQTIWINMSSGWGYRIWAEKPDLNKKWAKEFILWMENMNIQEMMAEKGGIIPSIRGDFMESADRMAKVQQAPRAFLEYTKSHKVRFENNMRDFLLTDPTAAQAQKMLEESIVPMATGQLDSAATLQKIEDLIQQAIKAQPK